jgi:hypothetical protein
MSRDDLVAVCRSRGFSDEGSTNELAERCRLIFESQSYLIGFGEISGFGREQVKSIFTLLRKNESGGGMTLWEMNTLLFHLGSKTIFDNKDYLAVAQEEVLLTDEEKNLSFESFCNYYEKYGRLAVDMQTLGIGSLNDYLTGSVTAQLEYDVEGLLSLVHALEPQSVIFAKMTKFLLFLSSISDCSADSKCSNFEQL